MSSVCGKSAIREQVIFLDSSFRNHGISTHTKYVDTALALYHTLLGVRLILVSDHVDHCFKADVLVIFVPTIREVFGFIGATSASMLVIILPSLFYIRLGEDSITSPKKIVVSKESLSVYNMPNVFTRVRFFTVHLSGNVWDCIYDHEPHTDHFIVAIIPVVFFVFGNDSAARCQG